MLNKTKKINLLLTYRQIGDSIIDVKEIQHFQKRGKQ